jgi:hypothetical protein
MVSNLCVSRFKYTLPKDLLTLNSNTSFQSNLVGFDTCLYPPLTSPICMNALLILRHSRFPQMQVSVLLEVFPWGNNIMYF